MKYNPRTPKHEFFIKVIQLSNGQWRATICFEYNGANTVAEFVGNDRANVEKIASEKLPYAESYLSRIFGD
jgi:hypothetical protein